MSNICDTSAECQKHDENKLDINDPRTYCFNLASKEGDVCVPKDCRIVHIGGKHNEEDKITSDNTKPTELIPIKQPVKTCIPWQDIEAGKYSGLRTLPEDEAFLGDNGSRETETSVFTKPTDSSDTGALAAAFVKPTSEKPRGIAATGSVKSVDPAHGSALGSAVGSAVGSANEPARGSTHGHARGFPEVMMAKTSANAEKETLGSMMASNARAAFRCKCCECDPCICGPRGLNMKKVLSAIKQMMGSGEDLNEMLAALGPGSKSVLETILGKESETAAEWAAGGSASQRGKFESVEGRSLDPTETDSQRALREAWMRGDFNEMTSCHCLPGMCPCPGGHYVFNKKPQEDEKEKKNKKRKKIRKKVKKIGKDGKEYEEWDWAISTDMDRSRLSETCVCPPTKHFLTPASSETVISGQTAYPGKRIYWGDLMICACPRLQRTLVILKPETVKFRDVVLRAIKNYGLDVLAERKVQLTPEEASEIYAKYYGTASFPNMVVSISQAPVIVLSLGGIDAVKIWNHMTGPDGTLPGEWFMPDWISRMFGHSRDIVDALHSSKNVFTAENENRYFFPESYIDPIMSKEADVKDFVQMYVNPTLLKGLTLLAKERPVDPIIFLAEWLLTHNPFQPHFPVNVALSPT